ncbi:MAG TPA: type II secretion system protein GspN [Polyangia bacterium]|nr:type II secretion system protein GspN [Polyangia bacterium]
MNPRLQALVDQWNRIELTPRQKQLLSWIGYPAFALFVALAMFLTSVPKERVKDRLESALSADVSTGQPMAIGMDVTIGDFDLTMLTGVGFNAKDIVLRTRPINVTEKPTRYLIDDVRIRMGVLSTLFGTPSYSFTGHALSGEASGQLSGNNDGTKMKIALDKLVLTGVPSIQQAVGLPLEGTLSGKIDLDVVKNLVGNTSGTIDIDLEDAAIGDGKAKLTVPNDPFLAAGITFPRIQIGKLAGQIIIEKGRARFEGVRVHSADIDMTLEGYLDLRDPIGMSQLNAYLKFRPSEALVKREPTIEIVNNSLGATGKRSDGYIGIQLSGSLMALRSLPSQNPPPGVSAGPGGPPSPTTTTAVATPPPRVLPQVAQPPAPVYTPTPPPPPPPPANNNEPPANAAGGGGGSAPPPGAGSASSAPGAQVEVPPPMPQGPPGPRGMMRPAFRGGIAPIAPSVGGNGAVGNGGGGGTTEEAPAPAPPPAPAGE